MFDASAFVGVPWRDRGRALDGCDCWGLFRLAFVSGTGLELPSHADGYRTAADARETAQVLATEIGDWQRVERERPFDAVVMSIGRRVHIGLYIGRRAMLHMPFGGTSVIESWAGRYRLEGIYRHKGLT